MRLRVSIIVLEFKPNYLMSTIQLLRRLHKHNTIAKEPTGYKRYILKLELVLDNQPFYIRISDLNLPDHVSH